MNTVMNALPISDTIKTAWSKTYGSKTTFWAAIIIVQLINIALLFFGKMIVHVMLIPGLIILVAASIIIGLLQLGIYYIGIQRAANAPITYKQIYHTLSTTVGLNLIGLCILQIVILIAPGLLAALGVYLSHFVNPVVPIIVGILYLSSTLLGIYLFLGMVLGAGFVLANNMGPLDAITNSFHVTSGHIIELLVIYVCFTIILFLLALPLGIGLIWGIPYGYVLYGEVFQRLATRATPVEAH